MFIYEKKLQYPVKIKNTNPKLASVIISQYGGPDGELGASLRYLSQRYSMPYAELKGLLTDIGTEELGHLEMIGAIVHQLTRDLTEEQIRTAGFDTYFVDRTAGVYPTAASGFPYSAASMAVKGDLIADLTEDLAAEQKARVTYDNILRLSDDPDVNDVIKFLRAREIGAGAFCGDSVPVLHQVFHQGHEPGLVFLPVGKELQGIALLLDEAADGDIPGHGGFQIKNVSLRALQVHVAAALADGVQELLHVRFGTQSHGKHILSVSDSQPSRLVLNKDTTQSRRCLWPNWIMFRSDSLQNIDELHKKTIIFYAVNTISKIAARSVMKYRCAVIKKEIHAYGLPVYLEKMLSLAAAAHALVFIKAVVAAGICKQVEFIQSLLFQIGKRGMKQLFADALSLTG